MQGLQIVQNVIQQSCEGLPVERVHQELSEGDIAGNIVDQLEGAAFSDQLGPEQTGDLPGADGVVFPLTDLLPFLSLNDKEVLPGTMFDLKFTRSYLFAVFSAL